MSSHMHNPQRQEKRTKESLVNELLEHGAGHIARVSEVSASLAPPTVGSGEGETCTPAANDGHCRRGCSPPTRGRHVVPFYWRDRSANKNRVGRHVKYLKKMTGEGVGAGCVKLLLFWCLKGGKAGEKDVCEVMILRNSCLMF